MVVLHAVRVELVGLVGDGLAEVLPYLLALGAGGYPERQLPVQLGDVRGVVDVQGRERAISLADARVVR